MAAELVSLREEKEDLKLEMEIVIRQLDRYEKMGYGCSRPMCMSMAIQENAYNIERDSIAHRLVCEIDNLQRKLSVLKSTLKVYQDRECSMLHARRQAALARHRREYEQRHPNHALHSRTDADSDSEYDTIDS